MITDDEVLQLFEQADPARVSDDEASVDAAGYLDALRTRSTDMTLIENPPRRNDPKARNHGWLLVSAAAAVVVLIVGTLVVTNRHGSTGVVTDQTPVATSVLPPTPAAAPTESETVAQSFAGAYAAFDVESTASLATADADLSLLGDNPAGWEMYNRFLQAMGAKLLFAQCEEQESSSVGTWVRCPFLYHAIRSDQIGRGPYPGSWFDVTVSDGRVASASMHWEFEGNEFSPEMWEPFAAWVSDAHPEDAMAMYTDSSHHLEQVSDESIPLWEQRTREYVDVIRARAPYIAEASEICRAATDQYLGSSEDAATAARLAEQSRAQLLALEPPAGDPDFAAKTDELITQAGLLIDVLNEMAAVEAAGNPVSQELIARRLTVTLKLDLIVPGLTGCPIKFSA